MKNQRFLRGKLERRAIPILIVLILSLVPLIQVRSDDIEHERDITGVQLYEDDGVTPTDYGKYGDTIVVKGSGVTGGAVMNLGWDGLGTWDGEKGVLNTTEAEGDGSFEIWFDVPEATNGTHYIWLKDTDTGETWGGVTEANSDFNVHAKIKFSPRTGLADDIITLKGYGFDAEREILQVIFDTEYHWVNLTEISLIPAHPVTNTLGSWEATFRVPDLPYGDYLVEATQRGYHPKAIKRFTISPTITLDVEEGSVGKVVGISGRGFSEGAEIDTGSVKLNGIVCFVTINDTVVNGEFTIEAVIPSVFREDDYEIIVSDGMGGSAVADFKVTGLAEIVVEPQYGAQGSTVKVYGYNFTQISGEEVSLELWSFAGDIHLVDVDTYETDANGMFSGPFTVPAWPSGVYTIMARQEGHDTTDDYNINGSTKFLIRLILVQLLPNMGPTGTRAQLTGVGFTEGGEWNATFDSIVIVEHGDVTFDGTLELYGGIPTFFVPTISPGTYNVTVLDIETEIEVKAEFEVTNTTTVILTPGAAPYEYNVTVEGKYFSAEEGTNLESVLWNATDCWYMDVLHGSGGLSVPVETDEDGSFVGWWEVPDETTLSLGDYTINVTDDNGLHAQCTFSVVIAPTVSISTDKSQYHPGETVRMGITLVNPHDTPFPSTRLTLDIVWPTGDCMTLFDSGEFTMPPGFSKVLKGGVPIPDSVFVPEGDYGFRAKLHCGGYVGSSTAWFEVKRPAHEFENVIELLEIR